MKKLIPLLLLATGCATIEPAPLEQEFRKNLISPYLYGVNDCTNKAGRYCKALREYGEEAEVVIFKIPHAIYTHAVVRSRGEYFDPTQNKRRFDPDRLGWKELFVVSDKTLERSREFR